MKYFKQDLYVHLQSIAIQHFIFCMLLPSNCQLHTAFTLQSFYSMNSVKKLSQQRLNIIKRAAISPCKMSASYISTVATAPMSIQPHKFIWPPSWYYKWYETECYKCRVVFDGMMSTHSLIRISQLVQNMLSLICTWVDMMTTYM